MNESDASPSVADLIRLRRQVDDLRTKLGERQQIPENAGCGGAWDLAVAAAAAGWAAYQAEAWEKASGAMAEALIWIDVYETCMHSR